MQEDDSDASERTKGQGRLKPDLEHQLNRVIKLIKKREEVLGGNKLERGESTLTSGLRPQNCSRNSDLKRTPTSLSEKRLKNEEALGNQKEALDMKLSNLRIVKKIHATHVSQLNVQETDLHDEAKFA